MESQVTVALGEALTPLEQRLLRDRFALGHSGPPVKLRRELGRRVIARALRKLRASAMV